MPARPAWVVHYGPQPPADAPWRHDPRLKGRFHPSFPDDLQAIVHDGEPRRTGRAPELCWVRLDGAGGTLGAAAVYSGRLLNQPRQLATAQQGDALLVLVSASLPHPVRVEARYLEERARWSVRACDKCGADEGLDPPSVMARTRFADAPPDAEMRAFSAFCALCGGVQIWQFTG